jgi:eukaryotic-like serine/threonine-protein kinase
MTQIGRYEIVGQTGNHGLGSLYQAFDPVMHRPVMIRIADRNTNPGISFDQARQAILFDAKQLATLDHPNIIKFLACEEDDGCPYLVMERFDGKPLAGRLSPGRLAIVLKGAALALDHAHSKGLIHRNLTPDSLLIPDDESDHLKITGFEIARPAQYLNSDQAGQDLDLLLDSIHYMSPELVKGDPLGAHSDQYSLGVIAWQALTGDLPFHANSPITLLSNIAFEPPDLRHPSIAMKKVFERVLSKNPGDRFASTSEFASAFHSALMLPAPAPEPAPASVPVVEPRPEPKKSMIPWIIIGTAIIAAAVTAAIFVTRPTAKPVSPALSPTAPQIVPEPPPRVVKTQVDPPKPKPVKKAAPKQETKDTAPEPPKLKPVEPKVIHQ